MQNVFSEGKDIDCSDIYIEETQRYLKTLKRFREAWLRSSSGWNVDLFQYADSEFYFYRFAVDRQEKSKEPFLIDVLYRVMERYRISFEKRNNAPFDFIVCEENRKIGYRLSDFYEDDNVNELLDEYSLEGAYIIRTWKPGKSDEWIDRENRRYQTEGISLRSIPLKTFFDKYFSLNEYDCFSKAVEQYLKEAREHIGYSSIKILSSMNLAVQKTFEEKVLADFDYERYKYQIIDYSNKKVKDFLYLAESILPANDFANMENQYIKQNMKRTMVGGNDYAESFITSEWLYNSLKGKNNFDYTSVISGYLKSIEQLLFTIVMINVNNNCKISMSATKKDRNKARTNGVIAYAYEGNEWKPTTIGNSGYIYCDFTSDQVIYMDSSIGTFEHFIRYNKHIFRNPEMAEMIADMVCCFRVECRNGFFHTHNLRDWDIVEKTRSNALFLYFVLVGACIIPAEKEMELGIISSDDFDELCKKIREFCHYNIDFLVEYPDGRNRKLLFDMINNTMEYSDEGFEHYQSLRFYEVEDYSLQTLEKIDAGLLDDHIWKLTRENLPSRIWGIHRNSEREELYKA